MTLTNTSCRPLLQPYITDASDSSSAPPTTIHWNLETRIEIEDVITSIWLIVLTAESQDGL